MCFSLSVCNCAYIKNPPNGQNLLFIYLDNLLPVDANLASKMWRHNLNFVSISSWLNLI